MSKHRRRHAGAGVEGGTAGGTGPAAPDGSLLEVAVYGLLGAVVAGAVMLASGMPWWQAAVVPGLGAVVAGLLLLVWSTSRSRTVSSARPADDGATPVRRGRRRRT